MAYNTMRNSSGFQGDIESGFSPELNGDIPGNIVLGIQGPPGGYYTPSVSQPDASTMRIRHTASKSDMPGVNATDVTLPPGPKGDPFTFEDFTPEQLEVLRGPKGNAFTYEDFTPEQLENLRGEPGEPGKDGTVSFDELTEAQKESLKGDPFRYEDFTAEQLEALKGEPGTPGKDGYTPQIELLNVVENSTSGATRYGVNIKVTNVNDDGTESVMLATVWDGNKGAPGDDYVLTPDDKNEIAEMAAELVEVPEGSGGGIAVTGAKVGQTVKISEVDENGVPTAWEPTDFPSGGGSGSLSEKWELISEGTITEETAGLDISEDINGESFKLSKCYFYCVIQPCETVGANTQYITTKINGRTAMQNANCAANTVRYYQCLAFLTGAAVIGGQAVAAQKYNHSFAFTNNSPDQSNWEGVDSINKVSLVTSNAGVLFVGVNSTYKLYGVRV